MKLTKPPQLQTPIFLPWAPGPSDWIYGFVTSRFDNFNCSLVQSYGVCCFYGQLEPNRFCKWSSLQRWSGSYNWKDFSMALNFQSNHSKTWISTKLSMTFSKDLDQDKLINFLFDSGVLVWFIFQNPAVQSNPHPSAWWPSNLSQQPKNEIGFYARRLVSSQLHTNN